MLGNDNLGVGDWECDLKAPIVFGGEHRRANLTFEESSIPIDYKSFEGEAMGTLSAHLLVVSVAAQDVARIEL